MRCKVKVNTSIEEIGPLCFNTTPAAGSELIPFAAWRPASGLCRAIHLWTAPESSYCPISAVKPLDLRWTVPPPASRHADRRLSTTVQRPIQRLPTAFGRLLCAADGAFVPERRPTTSGNERKDEPANGAGVHRQRRTGVAGRGAEEARQGAGWNRNGDAKEMWILRRRKT